jgi:TonB family protein
LQSKSRNLNTDWFASAGLHGAIAGLVALLLVWHPQLPSRSVDIDVIEAPRVSPQAVQITKPITKKIEPIQHQVFGASRKSITAIDGVAVKAGNTVAKAPDNEVLKPSDADSLPIPSDEYLISKMPELRQEVRIPYPPDAKAKGIQGAVVMDLLIDKTGKVREVVLVNGPDPSLSEAAVKATKNFEFSPALIQDKPVAVRIRYAYRFILEH